MKKKIFSGGQTVIIIVFMALLFSQPYLVMAQENAKGVISIDNQDYVIETYTKITHFVTSYNRMSEYKDVGVVAGLRIQDVTSNEQKYQNLVQDLKTKHKDKIVMPIGYYSSNAGYEGGCYVSDDFQFIMPKKTYETKIKTDHTLPRLEPTYKKGVDLCNPLLARTRAEFIKKRLIEDGISIDRIRVFDMRMGTEEKKGKLANQGVMVVLIDPVKFFPPGYCDEQSCDPQVLEPNINILNSNCRIINQENLNDEINVDIQCDQSSSAKSNDFEWPYQEEFKNPAQAEQQKITAETNKKKKFKDKLKNINWKKALIIGGTVIVIGGVFAGACIESKVDDDGPSVKSKCW